MTLVFDANYGDLDEGNQTQLVDESIAAANDILASSDIAVSISCATLHPGSVLVRLRTPFVCTCNPVCVCVEDNPSTIQAASAVGGVVDDRRFTAAGLTAIGYIPGITTTTTNTSVTDLSTRDTESSFSTTDMYILLAVLIPCLVILIIAFAVVSARRKRAADKKPADTGFDLETPVNYIYTPEAGQPQWAQVSGESPESQLKQAYHDQMQMFSITDPMVDSAGVGEDGVVDPDHYLNVGEHETPVYTAQSRALSTGSGPEISQLEALAVAKESGGEPAYPPLPPATPASAAWGDSPEKSHRAAGSFGTEQTQQNPDYLDMSGFYHGGSPQRPNPAYSSSPQHPDYLSTNGLVDYMTVNANASPDRFGWLARDGRRGIPRNPSTATVRYMDPMPRIMPPVHYYPAGGTMMQASSPSPDRTKNWVEHPSWSTSSPARPAWEGLPAAAAAAAAMTSAPALPPRSWAPHAQAPVSFGQPRHYVPTFSSYGHPQQQRAQGDYQNLDPNRGYGNIDPNRGYANIDPNQRYLFVHGGSPPQRSPRPFYPSPSQSPNGWRQGRS